MQRRERETSEVVLDDGVAALMEVWFAAFVNGIVGVTGLVSSISISSEEEALPRRIM